MKLKKRQSFLALTLVLLLLLTACGAKSQSYDMSMEAPAAEPEAPMETAVTEEAKMEMEYGSFNTTSQALAFERACRKAQAPGRLSPIPRQVSAGCGYAWQAPLTSWDAVVKAANDAGCAYESLHQLAL